MRYATGAKESFHPIEEFIVTDIQKLKLVPLFSTMDDQEIGGIRAIMDDNTFAPGQVIIREGEPGDHFHVITDGQVQFLTQDAAGGELVLDEAGPGGFFGELSMLTGEPRSARVRAMDEVKTLSLDRQEFSDFLMTHPHAAIDVMTVLGKRLHRSDMLLRKSVSKNVNQIEDARMTFGQRLSDGFASMMGSWKFIIWQSCLLAVWVTWNAVAGMHNTHHPDNRWFLWDEYPFIFLNLALSFQAAYAAPIIMMSQNRSADKDRVAAEVDHTVNLKAEVEVGLIMRRLDDLERSIHYNHHEACRIFRGDTPQSAASN
jgi:CRP/FNR family cyclic AMP-dependent transcriptional regulator